LLSSWKMKFDFSSKDLKVGDLEKSSCCLKKIIMFDFSFFSKFSWTEWSMI
jgi:hypothetical protein